MEYKKKVLVLILSIVVVFVGMLYVNTLKAPVDIAIKTPPVVSKNESKGEVYINERGEKWQLGEKADFTVSSKPGEYPQFVSGKIDPLKVYVGQTQKMEIVVRSDSPIVSVVAEIETDTKTRAVPLLLVESKAVTEADFKNQKFIVAENGELVENTPNNIGVIEKLIATAKAEGVVEYVYKGEWVVEDTHVRTYHTVFVAKDERGREDKLILAWSDPCSYENGQGIDGFLFGSCSFANLVEGLDNANLTIPNGITLTVGSAGTFVFNVGKSIIVNSGGRVVVSSGGQILQSNNLYYTDADGDTYAPNATMNTSAGRRVYQTNGTNDCYDSGTNAASVHPGQTAYFRFPDGRGSYDYDCSVVSITGVYVDSLNGNSSVASGYSTVYDYVSMNDWKNGACSAQPFSTWGTGDCGIVSNAGNTCTFASAPFPQLSLLERAWNATVPDALAIGPAHYQGFYSDSSCTFCISGSVRGYCR